MNQETVVYSMDLREPEKIQATFYVYQATEEQIESLSLIPNTRFYKSEFTPTVCMEVEKKHLLRVAEFPFVYCIRAIPNMVTTWVTIEEARTYNDIIEVQTEHDSTVDPMDIAIIDDGYDAGESLLNGEASDNIEYKYDFTDGDHDVSDGDNEHGTTCLDLLARAFGDVGEDDSMYNDPSIYHVLKIGEGGDTNPSLARQAIEYCISNDMEVVSMSWGTPEPYDHCVGYWCELFVQGVEAGVTWVAGTGNHGCSDKVIYPSSSFYVMGVGSYSHIDFMLGSAVHSSFSNYGWIGMGTCWTCHEGTEKYGDVFDIEFKPNVYDAGEIEEIGKAGTSLSTPLVAAAVALGIYSAPGEPTSQSWVPGFGNVRAAIHSSHEWPVIPFETSYNGDVVDTDTLWHKFD